MTDIEKRFLLIVLSVSFASFMVRMNNYSVNVSLPAMAEHFGVGTDIVSRIVTSYLLIMTSTLLLFGKLGDRIGLKKIFVYGYGIFVFGSLLCGLSDGIWTLIGSRVIQATGGSMLIATSYAIISKFIPPERTGWAFGITSTASSLGVAAGAPLGGIITGYLSWHWIFLLNIPVGIAAIFLAGRSIPGEVFSHLRSQGKKDGASGVVYTEERFDILGAVLSFLGFSTFTYMFNIGKSVGWDSQIIIICLVSTVVFLSLFILREKTCSAPLLDLTLFKNIRFTFVLCASLMAYLLISGNAFILPFYLKTIKGLNSQQIGMVLLVYSLVYVFMSSFAGRLSDRLSPVKLCSFAMLSAAINAFVFSYTLRFEGILFTIIFLVWMALSFVFFFSPNNKQVMSLAPPDKHGVASGVFNTTTNLSMVLGVAIFEAIFSQFSDHVYMKASGQGFATVYAPLLKGFNAVYIFGGLSCVCGLFFSFFVRSKS